MSIPDSVLIESRSARESQLSTISHERSQDVLSKVKSLCFALWQGTGIASTEQIADFYDVSTDVVRDNVRRFRDEFEADGLKVLKGKALKDVSETISLTSKTPQATAWTPRAALRLGMLLEKSAVAKQVRTCLLDAVEHTIPAQASELEKLKLQLELARTQERLLSGVQTLEAIAPGLGQLAMGNADVEVERTVTLERHVIVNERGSVVHEHSGQAPTAVAKSLGMKAPKELKAWLNSIGRTDLIENAQTVINCDFIRAENIKEIRKLWSQRKGSRQKLIGES